MGILKTLTINGKTYQIKPSIPASSVTLVASEWSGGGNRYSQAVAISGVSATTQVDLTPSEEQLAIFYDKSLAFVAENDGGIVTVYAIGQKPERDHTIQVKLTEVSATGKIIGVTVGTPTSPAKMAQELKPVRTINGVPPDENGNVAVAGGGEVDLSNYYTKSEVDSLIPDATDVDLSNYYTKAEVDGMVAGGEVNLGNYYTKAEADAKGYQTETQVRSIVETAINNLPVYDGSVTKGVV